MLDLERPITAKAELLRAKFQDFLDKNREKQKSRESIV